MSDEWEITLENSPQLTEAEVSLVNLYRALPAKQQQTVMQLAFLLVMESPESEK